MRRWPFAVSAVTALLIAAGCANVVDVPGNVTVGVRPARLARGPASDFAAPPQISGVWLSSLVLQRGATWSGEVTTSSNVASVEIRTDTFSFSVPRRALGAFAFQYDIPDLPPYLRRRFMLHIVARNAGGDSAEEIVPIEIR